MLKWYRGVTVATLVSSAGAPSESQHDRGSRMNVLGVFTRLDWALMRYIGLEVSVLLAF